MWIDPGWLDFKIKIAERRDARRRERWAAAPWWQKVWIWMNGDSPSGYNHRCDWQ